MAGIILIAAIGIFTIGVTVGIIAMVSHGIRREQQHFEEARRFREEHGIWDSPDYYLTEHAPDGVSLAARRLNGLYVRHLPATRRNDADLAARS